MLNIFLVICTITQHPGVYFIFCSSVCLRNTAVKYCDCTKLNKTLMAGTDLLAKLNDLKKMTVFADVLISLGVHILI